MRERFALGTIVQHFKRCLVKDLNEKDYLYVIDSYGRDTTTGNSVVIYHSLKDGDVWVRPEGEFFSSVDKKRYKDINQKYRFELYKKESNEMAELKNKLSKDDILAKVKDVKYTVLEDGKTTIANLYLENGFTVRGESACVDSKNFDKAMGEEIAYKQAIDKVWELEGYLLSEKLYQASLNK